MQIFFSIFDLNRKYQILNLNISIFLTTLDSETKNDDPQLINLI